VGPQTALGRASGMCSSISVEGRTSNLGSGCASDPTELLRLDCNRLRTVAWSGTRSKLILQVGHAERARSRWLRCRTGAVALLGKKLVEAIEGLISYRSISGKSRQQIAG
jgi:hypothetical protein